MISASARVVVDVGAGDGHASLRLARADPTALAIALDASMDRLRDGARAALRGRIPNTLFVVAPIESLPTVLERCADVVTVNFPWGSLLRGLAQAEATVLDPLARLAKSAAPVQALVSVETRDRASGLAPIDPATLAANASAYARAGFALEECRTATPADVSASGSSWAKRLGPDRSVVALTLRRM